MDTLYVPKRTIVSFEDFKSVPRSYFLLFECHVKLAANSAGPFIPFKEVVGLPYISVSSLARTSQPVTSK